MRLPAASTPMSAIVAPRVGERGLRGFRRQVDGVLVGVLPELRHVDPEDPDVVTHRCAPVVQAEIGSKPNPIASTPLSSSPSEYVARLDLHPELHVLRIGVDVQQVPAHRGAVAVDDRGDEGRRDARCRVRDDRERPHFALAGDVGITELGAEARRAPVATIEVPRAARRCTRARVDAETRRVPGSRRAGLVHSSAHSHGMLPRADARSGVSRVCHGTLRRITSGRRPSGRDVQGAGRTSSRKVTTASLNASLRSPATM